MLWVRKGVSADIVVWGSEVACTPEINPLINLLAVRKKEVDFEWRNNGKKKEEGEGRDNKISTGAYLANSLLIVSNRAARG